MNLEEQQKALEAEMNRLYEKLKSFQQEVEVEFEPNGEGVIVKAPSLKLYEKH